MITLLYTYKNKDLRRVKKSLDSLLNQTNKAFEIVFVDYGSDDFYKNALSELLTEYQNVKYIYSYHKDQPWSRAKALNIGIKQVDTEFVFMSDIDMIFRYDFIEKLYLLKSDKMSVCFRVGFLDEEESKQDKSFESYKIKHLSGVGAEGLSLFSTSALKKIQGFDEFFHFWGAEDEDVHNRLLNKGLQKHFYQEEVLMLHQWHVSYRRSESMKLAKELQLSNIVRINQHHLKYNKKHNVLQANCNQWGNIISELEYNELKKPLQTQRISNLKSEIDHFLFFEIDNLPSGAFRFQFLESNVASSLKYRVKKMLMKPVQGYYEMKEINDKLLLHLISFYNTNHYTYIVGDDLKSIELTIKK